MSQTIRPRYRLIPQMLHLRSNYSLLVLLFLLITIILRPFEVKALSIETSFHYAKEDYSTDPAATYISSPLRISGQPFKNLSMEIMIPYVVNTASIGSHDSKVPISSTDTDSLGFDNGSDNGNNKGNNGKGNSNNNSNSNDNGNARGNQYGISSNGNSSDNKKHNSLVIKNNNDIDSNSISSTKNITESNRGLGDICLLWSYSFHTFFNQFPLYIPTFDISGGIKFPTANSDIGLGTGEFDYTLGLTLNWDVSMVTAYLYGDYTWVGGGGVGDSNEADFENISCFGCGTDIYLSPKNIILIAFSGSTPLYSGNSCPLSLSLGAKRKILSRYWIHGYGLIGLNEESIDYGCGASISTIF